MCRCLPSKLAVNIIVEDRSGHVFSVIPDTTTEVESGHVRRALGRFRDIAELLRGEPLKSTWCAFGTTIEACAVETCVTRSIPCLKSQIAEATVEGEGEVTPKALTRLYRMSTFPMQLVLCMDTLGQVRGAGLTERRRAHRGLERGYGSF